jgi:hypothetical protein
VQDAREEYKDLPEEERFRLQERVLNASRVALAGKTTAYKLRERGRKLADIAAHVTNTSFNLTVH